jgi:hypothetical protein
MQRLRVLSEDECYTRLYGRNAESAVSVYAIEQPRPRVEGPSGEALRRLFEERLDTREPQPGEEAA